MGADRQRVRSALPYAVVMATGGTSNLARSSVAHPLATPLLLLAVAEVVAVPVVGLVRRRSAGGGVWQPAPSTPAEQLFGDFTIPVGLAVVATGLVALGNRQTLDVALFSLTLGWVSTVAVSARVATPMVGRPPGVAGVDGTWFLAPAALLADAVATAAVVPRCGGSVRSGLGWLALAACALGVAGYVLTVVVAAVRVRRIGVGNTPQAPWWISAGCGGLAAAAVGRVAAVSPVGGASAAAGDGYAFAALALWAVGSALLVPVVAGSLVHLLRLRRPLGAPPWPPTFSTGVYALGAAQAGRLGHLPVVTAVGQVAGSATVALWLVTAGLYLAYVSRSLRPRHRR